VDNQKNIDFQFYLCLVKNLKMEKERDYILGTHRAELERLKLQHQIWRPYALEAWKKAGVEIGSKILDVGAGPGYATFDLQNIVGPTGNVVCVERSNLFIEHLNNSVDDGIVQAYELDLMEDELPEGNFDFAWCRWVACFVHTPAQLVEKIVNSLKPGGKVIFHEYAHYESWQMLPPNNYQKQFIEEVMKSWRSEGGEPNIALFLPDILHKNNCEIVATTPLVFSCTPKDKFWQWPKTFIEINLNRQVELGKVSQQWANEVLQSFKNAERNLNSLQITPLVLEIIAQKK